MSTADRREDQSRRSFVKKAAYVAPVIITLDAMPAFASHDCRWKEDRDENGNNGVGNGLDPEPPGKPPVNDGEGTGRGNPGNRN
jgi:hypothetical protein